MVNMNFKKNVIKQSNRNSTQLLIFQVKICKVSLKIKFIIARELMVFLTKR